MRRLEYGFPFPAGDRQTSDAFRKLSELWQGSTPEKWLRTALANILGGTPPQASLWGFGCYLLETLLGTTLWEQFQKDCPAGQPLELVLEWTPDDWELNRLHWELMRFENAFLAEQRSPEVSLVRRVHVPSRIVPSPLSIEPRVLFVVGTDLEDSRIRAGAEYLGLLRQLNMQRRALHHRILIGANGEELQEALKRYKPTILHFTCHGDWSGIQLKPNRETATAQEERDGFKRWNAQELYYLLEGAQVPLPAVVVVNACDSALGRPPSAEERSEGKAPPAPFAAELTRLGIPMVVAMAGRIADHAGRLFTRRLYEALLDSPADTPVDLGLAINTGRRAGLQLSGGNHSTSDWAFSQLLVRGDAEPRLSLKDARNATVRAKVAKGFQVNVPFCDRLEAFRDFERWLDSDSYGRPPFVIQGPDLEPQPVKYGATRLLEEFAVHALHSDYLPVLVSFPETDAPTPMMFLQEMRTKLQTARRAWELPNAELEVHRLLLRQKNPEQSLHPELDAELNIDRTLGASVLRLVLSMDLTKLARDANCKGVLLLLDGIHTWNPLLGPLLRMVEEGLSFNDLSTSVVVSCRRCPLSNASADRLIKDFVERRNIERHRIGKFPDALEALIYNQYLLQSHPPRVLDPDDRKAPELVELTFRKYVGGMPAQLHDNPMLTGMLEVFSQSKVLLSADDQGFMQACLQKSPAPKTPSESGGKSS
nr:CHAT domain-containing protein [Corallococcus carmarthensis]